jgi:hypothetical protein
VMHKEFWRDLDEYDLSVLRPDLSETLAVSAFVLSQLPTPASRKQLVKEMWKSGAECLVRHSLPFLDDKQQLMSIPDHY